MKPLSRSQSMVSLKSVTKEDKNDIKNPPDYFISSNLNVAPSKSKKVNFSISRLADRIVQESTGSDGNKKYCRLNFSAAANHKSTAGKILYWCKTKICGDDTKQVQPGFNVSGRDNIRSVGAKIFAESLNSDFINTREPFKEKEKRLILQGTDVSIYIEKKDGNYILTSQNNHRPYGSKILTTFSELELVENNGKFLAFSKDVEAYLKDQQIFGIKIDSILYKPPVKTAETEAYSQIEKSFQIELKNQKNFYSQNHENKLYISISPKELPSAPGVPEEKFINYKSFKYGDTLNSFRKADTLVNQDVINLVTEIESKNLPLGSEIQIDMLCASTQIGYKLVEKFPNFKFKLFINDVQDMESVSSLVPKVTPDNVSQITIMMSGEIKNGG